MGIKIQKAQHRTKKHRAIFPHFGHFQFAEQYKVNTISGINHQIPSHGYHLTEGPQLTFMKLFHKHVRNHDQARGHREI